MFVGSYVFDLGKALVMLAKGRANEPLVVLASP